MPVLRQEIEELDETYAYRVLLRRLKADQLGIQTLHLSDTAPYAVEDREISLTTLPAARDADFVDISVNE